MNAALSYIHDNYDINKDKRYSHKFVEISALSCCMSLNGFVNIKNNATENASFLGLSYLFDDENDLLLRNKIIIESFSKLETDWNGCGGSKIDLQSINLVSNILSYLNKQPDIFPTGRGTIHLEYDIEEKKYLEFEVYPERVHIFYVVDDESYNEDIQLNGNIPNDILPIMLKIKMNRIISLVYGK